MVHKIPDCGFANAYVITGSSGLMVVDVGSVGAAQDVEKYIRDQLGMSLGMVECITATHFHIDHIGGIAELLNKCPPTTKVLFYYLVRSYLDGSRKLSLINNWCSGLLPATFIALRQVKRFSHLRFAGLAGIPLPFFRNLTRLPFDSKRISYFGDPSVDQRSSAEALPPSGRLLGFEQWEFIETPGHTEDSVSFFHASTAALICGDLIINRGKGSFGELNRFHWDRKRLSGSYEMLSRSVKCNALYPGHGRDVFDTDNPLHKVKLLPA